MSSQIVQEIKMSNLVCNLVAHKEELITALCLCPECKENSSLCSLCLINYGHNQCRSQVQQLEQIPKELIELRQLQLNVVTLQEKINQQFKKLLSEIEWLLLPIQKYEDSPNTNNLNGVGCLLKKVPKNIILQSIVETNIQIKSLLENYNIKEPEVSEAQIQKQKEQKCHDEGQALFNQEKYDEAIIYFDKAIQMDQHNAEYQYWKGLSLHNSKKYEEAIKYFDKAIQFDQYNPEYQYRKGQSLFNLDKYDEAIICFDKVLQMDPNHGRAEYFLQQIKQKIKSTL